MQLVVENIPFISCLTRVLFVEVLPSSIYKISSSKLVQLG